MRGVSSLILPETDNKIRLGLRSDLILGDDARQASTALDLKFDFHAFTLIQKLPK